MTKEELQRITESAIADKTNQLMFSIKDVKDKIATLMLEETIKCAKEGLYSVVFYYNPIRKLLTDAGLTLDEKDVQIIVLAILQECFKGEGYSTEYSWYDRETINSITIKWL